MIGRSELHDDALEALEERLGDLRRRDPAQLTHPKGDELEEQPWFKSRTGDQWRLAFNDLDLDLGERFSQADFNEAATAFQTGLPRLADVVRTARPVRLRGAVHGQHHADAQGVRYAPHQRAWVIRSEKL